jgi:hypothetical protein
VGLGIEVNISYLFGILAVFISSHTKSPFVLL